MNNPLAGITAWKLVDGIFDLMGEFGRARQTGKSLRVWALVGVDDVNVIRYRALISEGRDLLYVPQLNQLWGHPKVRRIDGRETVLCDVRDYECVDWDTGAAIASAQKYEFSAKIKYMRQWTTLSLKLVRGCIDMSVFKDMEGLQRSFGNESAKIVKTKTMEFMQEVEQRKLTLYCLVAGGFGWGLGILTHQLVLGVWTRYVVGGP